MRVEAGGGGAEGAEGEVGVVDGLVGGQAGGVHVGEVGMEVAEGCDGGAFTGEDVDVGEEGVEGAGVS